MILSMKYMYFHYLIYDRYKSYSTMKVYDDYTNKEFNKNHKEFQKVAILFLNGGTSKP